MLGPSYDESSQSVSFKRKSNVGRYGGLEISPQKIPFKINGMIGYLEAGTGIEPVFTDLQSGA